MAYYGVMALIVILALKVYTSRDKILITPPKYEKYIFFAFGSLAIVSMIVVSSIRQGVGTDYDAYIIMFEHPRWFPNVPRMFIKCIEWLKHFSNDYHSFFVASSIIIYSVIGYSFLFGSDNPLLSFILFIIMEDYFCSMNVVRQYVAVAFTTAAFVLFIKKKKLVAFLLVIMAAVCVHPAALVVLAAPFIMRGVNSKLSIFYRALFIVISIVIMLPIIRIIITKYTVYGRYFSNSFYVNNKFSVAVPLLLIYVSIFFTTIIFCNDNALFSDTKIKLFYSSVFCNALILIISLQLTSNTYRLSYYFNSIIALLFPTVIERIDNRRNRLFILSMLIILFTVWTITLITHNNQNVLPYKTIFS